MNQLIKVEKTLTINKPAAELYHFWHDFENLPRFMKHLTAVEVYDDKRSHWQLSGPLGKTKWHTVIIEDRENESITWESGENAEASTLSSIHFQQAFNDSADLPSRGTEVKVVTTYKPAGGVVGDTISKLFGESPKQKLGDDLRRFKMLMETGEIATAEGQPKGHD